MAIIAAGKSHGIAPNADLYLVKTKNGYQANNSSTDGAIKTYGLQPLALDWAFNTVKRHIIQRKKENSESKSVINLSWGKPLSEPSWTSSLTN
jgi:hypothetical protein